jgi:hypothetical protein
MPLDAAAGAAEACLLEEALGRQVSSPTNDLKLEQPSSISGQGSDYRLAKLVTKLLPTPTENGGLDTSAVGADWKSRFPHHPRYSSEAAHAAAERELELAGGRTVDSEQRVFECFQRRGVKYIIYALEAFFHKELLLDERCHVLDDTGRAIPGRVKVFCPMSKSNDGVRPAIKYNVNDKKVSYVAGCECGCGWPWAVASFHTPTQYIAFVIPWAAESLRLL